MKDNDIIPKNKGLNPQKVDRNGPSGLGGFTPSFTFEGQTIGPSLDLNSFPP